MTSPDNTQNAQEPPEVCALCLTVGGGHNDSTCPAKPSDTQNDTSELGAQLEKIVRKYRGAWHLALRKADMAERESTIRAAEKDADRAEAYIKQALTTLIAQREQAAELRGRIDELGKTTEIWIHNQHEDDFSDYLQRRKATLQATKPEKGSEQ